MPMKMAMNRPKTAIAASPRSLMILTSWPAVSWPSRKEEAISRTANSARLYGTRSRTDSLKTLTAIQLIGRIGWTPPAGARPLSDLGDAPDEVVLERVANRIERDERSAGRGEIGQDLLGTRLQRQLERVALRRDLGGLLDLTRDPRQHVGTQI